MLVLAVRSRRKGQLGPGSESYLPFRRKGRGCGADHKGPCQSCVLRSLGFFMQAVWSR